MKPEGKKKDIKMVKLQHKIINKVILVFKRKGGKTSGERNARMNE